MHKNYDTSATYDTTLLTDYSSISSYATTQMLWALGEGLISASGGNCNPKINVARKDLTLIVKNFYDYVNV